MTSALSIKPPQIQLNNLEKTSVTLCALRCLFTELQTCKMILFFSFVGNFDDSDLAGSLPKGGGDGSGSNGKSMGCASC